MAVVRVQSMDPMLGEKPALLELPIAGVYFNCGYDLGNAEANCEQGSHFPSIRGGLRLRLADGIVFCMARCWLMHFSRWDWGRFLR